MAGTILDGRQDNLQTLAPECETATKPLAALMHVDCSMLSKIAVVLLLIGGSNLVAQSPPEPLARSCRARSDLVGKCFTVYGRLSVYNGTPSIRLWRIGSKRMLGVRDSEDISGKPGPATIPASIKEKLDWDRYIFGNFLVCPLTRSRPGRMQTICIESGNHLIVRKRK